jgi:hypothetical protein
MTALPCDACRRLASPQHVALRFRRLELATQFRPIHIGVLFLTDAPPAALSDYFYCAGTDDSPGRSPSCRAFFDSLMTAVGITPREGSEDSALLSEFQKRGCYLTECVECPLEDDALSATVDSSDTSPEEFAREHWPTLLKRIQYSYKPQKIVLFSKRTRSFIPRFIEAGWGDRLLLHRGGALELPIPGDSQSTIRFIVQLGSLVALSEPALRA